MQNVIERIPERYREDIQRGIDILKDAGCEKVYLFGSLVNGDIRDESDIDIAVRGFPTDMYFHILGKLMIELTYPVDLINLDKQDDFAKKLEKEGELMYVS